MEKKTDLRVIKTKKNLFNTLTELMKTNTFEEIKTSDICSKALINRSTFYAHYNDKYDLLVDFLNDLKESLIADLKKNEEEINTKEYFMKVLKVLIDHIDEKREIYSAILLNNRNGILMDILFDVVNNDLNHSLQYKNIPNDIIAKFYLGAIVSIGLEWIENSDKYTKEDIIAYLNILIPENIY